MTEQSAPHPRPAGLANPRRTRLATTPVARESPRTERDRDARRD